MTTDFIEHFSARDFFDSELLIFDYNKINRQVTLKCNYVSDRIHAVLNQENTTDYDDFYTYVFHNVTAMKRRDVAAFSERKNRINTFVEQISINLDAIKVEKKDKGFKIKVAFLDAFGAAYFQCENIDYQHITH